MFYSDRYAGYLRHEQEAQQAAEELQESIESIEDSYGVSIEPDGDGFRVRKEGN